MVSSYIGFEDIYRGKVKVSTWEPILNYPYTVAHIRRDDPYRVLPSDRFLQLTVEGTVAPDTRHIIVTDEVGTVNVNEILTKWI